MPVGIRTLEDQLRHIIQNHTAAGGVVSSPDRLISSILDSMDLWLEERERVCRRENRIDQAKAISQLRATRELTLTRS